MNLAADMQTSGDAPASPAGTRLDAAAALIVCLTLAVAVLYPENFITGVSFFGHEKLTPLVMLVPALVLFADYYALARRSEIAPGWLDAVVWLYSIFVLVRNLNLDTNLEAIKYVAIGLSVFYLCTILASRHEAQLRLIAYGVCALTLLTALYGFLEYAAQKNFIYRSYIAGVVEEPASGLHRIGSMLGHPVPYGAFLIQALPFAIMVWILARSRPARAFAVITVITGLIALLLTFSKGSWLVAAAIAGGVLLVSRAAHNRKVLVPIALLSLIVVIATAVFWSDISEEIQGRSFSSVDVRMKAWRGAVDAIRANLTLGVGIRHAAGETVKYVDQVWYADWGRPLAVDNYYLTLLLEAGVIGFSVWLAMLIMIFREGIKIVLIRGPARPWAIAAIASICGLLLNALTFEAFHIWPNFVLFWIAAGILHGLYRRRDGKAQGTLI